LEAIGFFVVFEGFGTAVHFPKEFATWLGIIADFVHGFGIIKATVDHGIADRFGIADIV
jgi:hypothetical protein